MAASHHIGVGEKEPSSFLQEEKVLLPTEPFSRFNFIYFFFPVTPLSIIQCGKSPSIFNFSFLLMCGVHAGQKRALLSSVAASAGNWESPNMGSRTHTSSGSVIALSY